MKILIAFALMVAFQWFVTLPALAQWVQTAGPNHVVCFTNARKTLFAGAYFPGEYGLFFTSDNGMTWDSVQLVAGNEIEAFANIGPVVLGGTDLDGIYRSTDSGSTWTDDTNMTMLTVYSFAVSGTDVFAAAEDPGSGILLSTDSGLTWNESDTGIPSSASIGALTANGSDVFAGTGAGIFHTNNGGKTWVLANQDIPTGLLYSALTTEQNFIFAGSDSGIFRSSDNGQSWTRQNTGLRSLQIECLAVDSNIIFVGTLNGVYLSSDFGVTWRDAGEGLIDTNIFALGIHGNSVFLGTDFNGIWRRPLSDFGISSVALQSSPISQDLQCYPNPFSQATKVSFSLVEAGYAEVSIVNTLGAEVARLYNGTLSEGEHSFAWTPGSASTGNYWCIIRTNTSVDRVVLLKE